MRRALVIAIALVACGEGGEPERGPRRRGGATLGGDVVATVDGVAVTQEDVARVARSAELAPRDALLSLESQALLAAEAERRGHADDPAVRVATQQAMVQALLAREVEAQVTPASIPRAEVEARWRETERFHLPERRASSHVLARVPRDASEETVRRARALAAEALAELRAAAEVGPVLERWRGQTRDGIQMHAETLPPMSADSALEEGYRQAMFSIDAPGVVPEPARTSYGWHAVVVTEILPAAEVPFEEAEPELREQMAIERRRTRYEALVASLRERWEVELDEASVRAALSQDFLSAAEAGAP